MAKVERRLFNIQKLDISAVYYSGRANTLSRYFNEICSDLKDELNVAQSPANLTCSHCKTFLHPGNHIVRFQPQHKVNKKVLKLLAQPNLTGMKRHLVDNHKNNKTCAIITCKICKKRTKLEGFKKPPKPKKVLVVEPTKELTRKEKKKMKKKAAKKRKLEESDDTGISLPLDLGPKKTLRSVESPILPKTMNVSDIKQSTPKTIESKTPGKSTKNNAKLQEMLKKKEKKNESKGGLQSFLSSINF